MSCVDCKTNDPCPIHRQVCTCIRLNCWHPYKACEEPPQTRGHVCSTCRAYREPERCPTCGQPIPSKSEAK